MGGGVPSRERKHRHFDGHLKSRVIIGDEGEVVKFNETQQAFGAWDTNATLTGSWLSPTIS